MKKTLTLFTFTISTFLSFGQVAPSDASEYYIPNNPAPTEKYAFPSLVTSKVLTITDNGVPCDGGIDTLSATGACSYYWSTDVAGTNVVSNGDSLITGFLANDTTFYLGTIASGPENAMPLPGGGSAYTGNVRGYVFTAPVDFVMTGLYIPQDVSTETQSIAVLLFDNQTIPPAYPTLTNTFQTLGYWTNVPANDTVFTCFQIFAGDVVGVYGQRGTTNSYVTSPYVSSIDGMPVTLSRSGMQYSLTTTPMQDVWTEAGGSISQVQMFYDLTPDTTVTTVNVTVPLSQTATANQVICEGDSIMIGGVYQTAAGTYVENLFTSLGCDSTVTTTLAINPLPNPTLAGDSLCEQDGMVALNGAPSGGTYSGTGVSGSNFNAGTGAGTYTITYDYTDGNGCSNTASAEIVVQDCASIGELALEGIQVYPNPMSEQISIVLPEEYSAARAQLMDANGKIVAAWTLQTGVNSFQIEGVSAGVYVLEVSANAGINTYKVIKK